MECSNPFVNEVDFFDPMSITWSFSVDGGSTWCNAGTSANQTYVTLGDPLTTVYHTLAHLGCVLMVCLLAMGVNAMGRDLAAPPLRIEGAKVSAQADAKRIAFEAYAKKMRAEILANESVQDIAIVTLGYDVRDFAAECCILRQRRATFGLARRREEPSGLRASVSPW